jgi:hypothetical protein
LGCGNGGEGKIIIVKFAEKNGLEKVSPIGRQLEQ